MFSMAFIIGGQRRCLLQEIMRPNYLSTGAEATSEQLSKPVSACEKEETSYDKKT